MWELDHKEGWELWCWRIPLRVPWTARRSNQSILKKINPEYSLQGLMLKLKLQYSGHLMPRANSLGKTLMLGKIEGGRRRMRMVGWHHQLNGHEFEQTPGDSERQGSLACCSSWGHNELDTTATEQQQLLLGSTPGGDRKQNVEVSRMHMRCDNSGEHPWPWWGTDSPLL